jgi:hypothetical protein
MSTPSSSKIKDQMNIFLENWHKDFKLLQGIYANQEDKQRIFLDAPYKNIEKSKLIFLFKLKESLSLENKHPESVIRMENDISISKFGYFDKTVLKTEDQFYQKYILLILLLFIIRILSYNLAIVILQIKYRN